MADTEAATFDPAVLARLRGLPRGQLVTLLRGLSEAELRTLHESWAIWALPGQREPAGDWQVWLIRAGRGFGKTRAGAEWVSALARAMPGARIAMVGGTMDDVRKVMVEGESGLIAVAQAGETYAGTRLGRQELDGELIDDVEGALWTRDLLERQRGAVVPALVRVVVGVDPPAGTGGDACGIVCVALGEDGLAYVLEDASVAGLSPEGWARAVAECAARHGADRVVAECNQGGDMVRSVLMAADCALPVRLVHASRGKVARAEPVATLYEGGRVFHVGTFPALEDELCGLVSGGYVGPGRSPDRADALVWALTELCLRRRVKVGVAAWLDRVLVRVDEASPGDVLMLRTGPGQLHFAVRTTRGLVHADAALRRVVERPGPVEAPVLGCWRIGEGNSGEVGPWRH